ncbi:MAG: hypothetical protein ABI623_08825, partial [bacterium]
MSRVSLISSFILAVSVSLLSDVAFSQLSSQIQLPATHVQIVLNRSNKDSTFQFPEQFIVEKSDSVVLDSSRTLQRGTQYTVDYRFGRITFDSVFVRQLFSDTAGQHSIMLYFEFFPFKFQDSYFRRKLLVLRDSTGKDTLRVSRPRSSFGLNDIFGQNLQKSGSIVRGFTVGSNRDFSLNSGLRLQLAGKLTSDIEVVAALTDENTPIQPEGTTQTLQEFDKVFVELRSTDATATLGDFDVELGGTEFASLTRKVQGAKVAANYYAGFTTGSFLASAASSRGKFNTNQFQGLEAVQGPYRLTGKNNERQIIVIAGSERVYINGEVQTRGETNDYTIDYSNGEVTFTPRRLITSASRITIDFEYTDRQFSRSFLAGQNTSSFLENRAKFTFTFLREADDPDAPIDITLTDSSRAVLQLAGDDRSKAALTGAVRVDSNGYYVPDSALVNGVTYRFFRYAPGKTAQYVISFSSVPFGQGEYIRQSVGVFVWKGPNQGDYLPVKFLPLPQSSRVMDFALDVVPTPDLKLTGEFGLSSFDANRLSTLDDGDNNGQAVKFEAAYTPKNVIIGGKDIGAFDLRLKERMVNKRFVPVDRTNEIEFNRKWGFDSFGQSDEEIQEASLRYLPTTSIAFGAGYGKITRGDELRSIRNEASFVMKGDSLPTVNYYLESIRTRENLIDNY